MGDTHHPPAQGRWESHQPPPTGICHAWQGGCHLQHAAEHTATDVSPWPGKAMMGALGALGALCDPDTQEQCFLLCPFPSLNPQSAKR